MGELEYTHALTLTQPWATLVVIGAKRIETRSWRTHRRGRIGIHAAKGFPRTARELVDTEPFRSALGQAGIVAVSALPTAALIGSAVILDCAPTEEFARPPYPEHRFGDYSPGRWAWILTGNVQHRPVPCSGALGIWDTRG